ncbi:MAG: metallophosphoesterase, partial [Phycisphaerae bacterium]
MNELLAPTLHKPWYRRRLMKRALWRAGRAFGLSGLFAWRFEDHWLRVEKHPMPLPELGENLQGATLAHISDVHVCPIVLERYLGHCVDAINEMEVDFVAITGDFITGPKHYARRAGQVLRRLHPRIATVACLGNHDYGLLHPSGIGHARGLADYITEQLTRADIFVMRNESRVFTSGDSQLQFVGLDDFWSSYFNPEQAFEMVREGIPTIALCHNPDAAPLLNHFPASWVLSGHTHGSPLPKGNMTRNILPAKHRHYSAGHYDLDEGKRLYVNRGLSYGRRYNLNSRPEVTLFT